MTPPPALPPTRVLIVDDHAPFRAVAGALLRRGAFEVVAEATTLADALQAIDDTHPDLVLLDVTLPDGDGIDGAAVISASEDSPMVVLVSTRHASDFGARLRDIRARGFITKDELSAASLTALL